jgi:hypothetical protein
MFCSERAGVKKSDVIHAIFSLLGTISVSILPIWAKAQYIELTSVSSREEVIESESFCFQRKHEESERECYNLTDFLPVQLTDRKSLPGSMASEMESLLSEFEWLEVSDFAFASTKRTQTDMGIIPFVARVRWRPKIVSVPGLPPNFPLDNEIFAFGLLLINEFENPGAGRIKIEKYAIEGEFPHLAQGAAAQKPAFLFHQENIFWLQEILRPVLIPYLERKFMNLSIASQLK